MAILTILLSSLYLILIIAIIFCLYLMTKPVKCDKWRILTGFSYIDKRAIAKARKRAGENTVYL